MEEQAAAGPLVGICIAYCDGGEVKKRWINMHAVQAIAWSTGKVDERPDGPKYGPDKIPPGEEPTRCTTTLAAVAPVCWWNGSVWVCGEA